MSSGSNMKTLSARGSIGSLKTAECRLTGPELLLIHAAAALCWGIYVGSKRHGAFPGTDFFCVYPDLRPPEGKFRPEIMNQVLALKNEMLRLIEDKESVSHRLHLDAISAAVIAFLVRAAAKWIRHGHISSPVATPERITKRLKRKLEKMRRRALRSAKAAGQGEVYKRLALDWHQFQVWARAHIFYCCCGRRIPWSSRHRHMVGIAECEKLAKQVILSEELQMPSPAGLHGLVRLCVRYARRGRLGVGYGGLLKGNRASRWVLARFFEKRLPINETTTH